jgi:Dioxygenases related to 2-nitropropane dioxygenase
MKIDFKTMNFIYGFGYHLIFYWRMLKMNEVCKLLGIKYPVVQGAMQEVATAD